MIRKVSGRRGSPTSSNSPSPFSFDSVQTTSSRAVNLWLLLSFRLLATQSNKRQIWWRHAADGARVPSNPPGNTLVPLPAAQELCYRWGKAEKREPEEKIFFRAPSQGVEGGGAWATQGFPTAVLLLINGICDKLKADYFPGGRSQALGPPQAPQQRWWISLYCGPTRPCWLPGHSRQGPKWFPLGCHLWQLEIYLNKCYAVFLKDSFIRLWDGWQVLFSMIDYWVFFISKKVRGQHLFGE